jgi:hypothetical protein
MWTHLLEAMLNGLCLFVTPLMLMVDRLSHLFGKRNRWRVVEPRGRRQVV